MKKNAQRIVAIFAFAALFSSCGPKLMTEAEMNKKIDEGYAKQIETLGAQLDKECTTNMDTKVKAKADALVQEAINAAQNTPAVQ
ncbi:MAG: hypothetical protein IPL95_18565 [Saprospiraceae bacterium]|jgi:hypothetical protein|nr:hypothetical protein [Saprospiraceae bacterium]